MIIKLTIMLQWHNIYICYQVILTIVHTELYIECELVDESDNYVTLWYGNVTVLHCSNVMWIHYCMSLNKVYIEHYKTWPVYRQGNLTVMLWACNYVTFEWYKYVTVM